MPSRLGSKIILFTRIPIYGITHPARATRRDVRAIVTERGAGCDGRCGVRRFGAGRKRCSVRRSRVVLAPRPWRLSAQPVPGAATVTIKAAHRGEHEGNRKTIARGKPGRFGRTCGLTRLRSKRTFCTRDCGRSRRPAFPAPSSHKRDNRDAQLGRKRAAGMRVLTLTAV